jgi:hypothetical protein
LFWGITKDFTERAVGESKITLQICFEIPLLDTFQDGAIFFRTFFKRFVCFAPFVVGLLNMGSKNGKNAQN